jgi:hypothetical protein
MIKLIQALLTSLFVIMIIDFFIFLGMQFHYLDFYKVPEFFNPFFCHNQSYYILLPSTVILTVMILFLKKPKILMPIVMSILVLISIASTFISSFGFWLGKTILVQDNIVLEDSRYTYRGNIYFEGRSTVLFYDKETKKLFELEKTDIIKKENFEKNY